MAQAQEEGGHSSSPNQALLQCLWALGESRKACSQCPWALAHHILVSSSTRPAALPKAAMQGLTCRGPHGRNLGRTALMVDLVEVQRVGGEGGGGAVVVGMRGTKGVGKVGVAGKGMEAAAAVHQSQVVGAVAVQLAEGDMAVAAHQSPPGQQQQQLLMVVVVQVKGGLVKGAVQQEDLAKERLKGL